MSTKEFIKKALSNEAHDMVDVGVINHVADIADTAIEVEELYAEVAASSDEISRLETAANALDRIVEESQGEAVIVTDLPVANIAIECLGLQLGHSNVSLENVHETLQAVWEATKDFIKRLIDSITKFFSAIFGGFKNLLARAGKLRVTTNHTKEDSKGTLSHPLYIAELVYKNKTDAASIIAGLSATEKDVLQTFVEVKRCAGGIAVGMAKAGALLSEGRDVTGIPIDFKNDFKTDEMSGGYSIDFDSAGTGLQIFFSVNHAKHTMDAGAKVDKATKAQVLSLVSHVEKICDIAIAKKDVVDNIKKVYDGIIEKTDKLMKENRDKGVLSRTFALRHHGYVGKLAMSNYAKTLTEISKVAFNVSRAALQYGEASIA